MKIPKTFIPENSLEEKIGSLIQESYPAKPVIEEKIDTQELYQLQELKSRWKKWNEGDHLNKPGTDDVSGYRTGINALVMLSTVAVSIYFCAELKSFFGDCIPEWYDGAVRYATVMASMFGSGFLAYRSMAEFFIRYDLWKYNKTRNKP